MPIPFLATLNLTARFAYPIIQSGVRKGLSSRALSSILTGKGLGIRRSILLDIMRREKTLWEHGLNMKFLPMNRRPNPLKLPSAIHKIRRAYSYVVSYRGYNEATGDAILEQITVATSNVLTRAEAQEAAMSYIEGEPKKYPVVVTNMWIENILKSGELGTFL